MWWSWELFNTCQLRALPAGFDARHPIAVIYRPTRERCMNRFCETLRQVRNGALETEMNDALQELVHEVERTGKKGSLTLTIEVQPAGEGKQFVNGATKAKLPSPTNQATLFYVKENGDLTRRDPRQPELPSLSIASGGAE
jgi:hypothetical protein